MRKILPLLLLVFLFGCDSSKAPADKTASPASGTVSTAISAPQAISSTSASTVASTNIKTLNLTPEEFRDRYNAKLAELKIDVTPPLPTGVIPLNNQNEKGATFHLDANPSAGIVGTVAPNGKLKEVIVMFRGEDKNGIGLYTVVTGMTFKTLLGDIADAGMVLDLIHSAMTKPHKDNTPYEKTINNVRVYALAGAPIGIWTGFQGV